MKQKAIKVFPLHCKVWRVIRFVHTRLPQQHTIFCFYSFSPWAVQSIQNTSFARRTSHPEPIKIETKLSAKANEEYKVKMKQQRKIKTKINKNNALIFIYLFFSSLSLSVCCTKPGTNNTINANNINATDERNNIKIKTPGTNAVIGIFGFRH